MDGSSGDVSAYAVDAKGLEVYELNLEKYKDRRDAVQKKTFTKWVNKHLAKADEVVADLFTDLQDGFALILLLEVLTGEQLHREKGLMRFHRIQNVQTCLAFLKELNVKLVNIRAEDIVDGSAKLTMGLIWTIILHFQVSEPWSTERDGTVVSARDGLLDWVQQVTRAYPQVNVKNFSTSWNDGLAFCAIMHHYRPSLINWREVLRRMTPLQRLETAFRLAESEFGVTRLLDPEDVDVDVPDEKSVITYVSSLYDALERAEPESYDQEFAQYCNQAQALRSWMTRCVQQFEERSWQSMDVRNLLADIERFRAGELLARSRDKRQLEKLYARLEELFGDTAHMNQLEPSMQKLNQLWDQLIDAISVRETYLLREGTDSGAAGASAAVGGMMTDMDLDHEIGTLNDKLDAILRRIEDAEDRGRSLSSADLQLLLEGIMNDLNDLEAPVERLFKAVEVLVANGHPDGLKFRPLVYGLHQRRIAYLQRCNARYLMEPNVRSEYIGRLEQERYLRTREEVFTSVKKAIEWVERRLVDLADMKFKESLPYLEELLENHKLDHREVMDFRHQVDQCIARQMEVGAEDTEDYCNHLSTLEKEYHQLRELSTGRMLDLDSLIAFVRSAQMELLWISEREEVEVARNWSDIEQLDLPMLQNYYKQLMHEIELRESQFNVVHDQGAALVNQRHPAVEVIEAYLNTMQSQWDWLLGLTQCLESHLHDAVNLREFLDDATACERWMERQLQLIETESSRGVLKPDEGDRLLDDLEEMREVMDRYHEILLSLAERSRTISPLWQRGEAVMSPIPINCLCNYIKKDAVIHKGDQCTLLDNSESLTTWSVRTEEGFTCDAPSVIYRIPPLDDRIAAYYQRLQSMYDRLRRSWLELYQSTRFALISKAMREVCSWDLKQFLSIEPENREAIIRAINDDVNKLLDDLDKNDPMVSQLRDELSATNEHFYKLLQQAMREPDSDLGDSFEKKANQLIQSLEDAWRVLNQRVTSPIPKNGAQLDRVVDEHKAFEDSLQSHDTDVTTLQELFRQLRQPSPLHRSLLDQVLSRWEDLWELAKLYAERLKAMELVLGSIVEATEICLAHERTLGSYEAMPADLERLRAVHAELLELQLLLQQQQPVFQDLASNVARMRQYVSRTRPSMAEHADVDQAEEIVQQLTVRWENICKQVIDRLKSTELATPILLVCRGAYEDEISWLDRVEKTISNLRHADSLKPEEYQDQLDLLMAEYTNLNERTSAVERVNREGGRFIREAKLYDMTLTQYRDVLSETTPSLRFGPFSSPTGCQVVTRELEELNHRFSQLASVILERRNVIQVLMQNWRRQKEEEERRRRATEEAARRAEEEARRRAEDEAERLRRLKEEEERRRRAAEDEAERLRRMREEEEARRQAEEARRKAEEEARRLAEEARRRAEEEARRRAAEEARRLAELEAARLRDEEEARRKAAEEARRRREEEEARRRAQEEADRLKALRDREDALRRAEEEARRRAEEEGMRRAGDEAARRRAEEAKRHAEEEARRRAEEEARRRAAEDARRRAEEEARRRAEEEEARRRAEEEEARRRAEEEARRRKPLDIKTGREWGEAMEWGEAGDLEEASDLAGVAKISEHEEDMIMYAEETEVRTKFFELEAVKHLQTGEILTFVEAARQGVLDLRSGEFFDVVSGSRISLEEAVRRGFVSQSLTDCLSTQYGIHHPETRQPLTLLEAIQCGLYDPEMRQLKNPTTGEMLSLFDASQMGIITMDNVHRLIKMGVLKLPPLSLQQAIEQAVIDLQTGTFIGRFSRETLPLTEALRNGYVSLSPQTMPMVGISLTDCIEQRFVHPNTGEFVDQRSGEKITMREALSKKAPLVNLDVREIVHTAERRRITVGEAVFRNVLNTRMSNFTDTQHRQAISLLDAYEQELIQKPLTLFDVCTKGLFDSSGRFVDGGTKRRMVLLEAIADGLIDPDVPHIMDLDEQEVISLATALERGIVTPAGEYMMHAPMKAMSIQEAVTAGHIVLPVRYSLFDVKAVRDTKKKAVVSFNEAVDEGIVTLDSRRFLDTASNQNYSLQQLQNTNLVEPVLLNVLTQMSGLKGPGGEHVTVFDAVALAMIDPKKRVLLNARREHFTPREAYESGLISLRGAMLMSGLFDVHPSLVYLGHGPKPRRKRIERTKATADGLRMTLGEALYQGLVDPKTRVVEGGRDMSLQEAVDTGFLDTSIEWIVPDKGSEFGPTIQESQSETVTETSQVLKPLITPDRHIEETTTTVKRQRITETTAVGGGPGSISTYRAIAARNGRLEVPVDGLHVYAAQRMGLFDLATGVLTVPDLQREFSFEEALELGIINGSSVKARDRRTSRFVGASEAISAGILDSHGFYVDSLSNRRMSLQAAIDAGMVVVDPEGEASATNKIIQFSAGPTLGSVVSFKPTGTSVREITETSLTFSGVTGEVLDTQTNERFSLDEALRREKISEDDFVITDALMERQLTFAEAEKWGVVDPNSKMYVNKRLNRICSLQEAAKQGLVALTFGIAKPSSDALETHVHRQHKKVVATKESVLAGPAAFVDYSLQKVIELGWYDPKAGTFTHPDTKKHMTLKQAIIKGLFNPYESTVVDPASKEEMNLLDAIQSGVLDADKGRVRDTSSGREYDLEEACRQGIISSGVVAQSLDALIASGRLDLNEGAVLLPDGRAPLLLHEAIAKRLVDTTSIHVMDPSSGEEMKYDQAVRKKVVDGARGLVVNKNTGEAVSFIQAIRSGVIKPLSRPDTARYQMVSPPAPSSMRAAPIPPPKKKGGFAAKGREEMVDIGGKQVMVKVIRDEHGVEKGEYVDPETNMKFTVQLHGDPYTTRTQTSVKSTSQVQSVELSPFAELIGIDTVQDKRSGRIMTLAEAQRAGLASVDRKGKQLTKTYAIFRSDIVHALNHGIVDPTTGERLSLEDAIKSRIVDIDALVMWHPDTGERMDFAQAANLGLMDVTLAEVLPKGVCHPVNGERISIRRAIELKIVNPRTGVVCNPFSNEKLTWVSIVKPVYASLVMEGVYDPRKGYAVPVSRALNEGLIDVRKETYCNPITGEVLPLEDASQLGLVDESTYKVMVQKSIRDFQSGQMVNLLQAVDRGLVNTHERTVTVDKSVTVPISKAMEDGKFPKEVGRLLKRVDKLTFAEALGQGLIDVATNQFTDPDSGHKMTISAALEQGYIDTGSVETLDGVDERNLSNVIHSEEFDENSGRIRDQKSGLYLTFKQAIERGIIDPDSLIYDVVSGRAMTVNEALNRGRIDFNGKFVDPKTGTKINLKDAIRVGLIGTIASPMQAAQAAAEAIKRRETEGVRFSFERPVPQGPTASATLLEEIVTVKGQQPQKIFRLQHEDDHQTVVEGPLASSGVDLQTEFLTHLLKDCLDLDEPVMKNPATGQAVSVNQAVDQGLLDVASGEIVNPHSGEHYSITRAVQLHLVPPKIASSIMTALNKSMEEREPSSSRAPQHQIILKQAYNELLAEMNALKETVLQWRRSVAEESPEIPMDKESLMSCVARIKEIKDLVQGLLPRIRDLENNVADISVSSAEFLTPDEFHHMLQSRDNLLKLYDMVQQCVLVVSDCLQTVFELTNTADNMIAETRHWKDNCLARLKVIEEVFRNGECDLETAIMEIEVVEADVTSRKAGLSSLNKVEEDLNAKYNDCLIELNILRKLAQPPLPAIDYRHSANIQSSRFNNYFISVTQAVHDLRDKLSRAKHAHDKFMELYQQIDTALTNSKDTINKSRPDSAGGSHPDVGSVRCRLDQLQAANDELISKKFIIKELQASVEQYESLFGKNCAQPKQFIEDIEKLQKKVESVEKELCSDIHALNDRLSESESLQKQLYSFDDWLYDVESKGHVRRLLPLNSKELSTLIAEQRAILSDVENHKHVLSSLLRKLSDDGEIVQVQAKQLETRLEAAEEDLRSYLSHLTQALDIVDNFVKCADTVQQELDMVQSEIVSLKSVDVLDLDLEKSRLEQICEKLDTLRGDIEIVQMYWKDLKVLPNKSDADLQTCYLKLQTVQDCWKKSQRLMLHRSEAQSRLSDKLAKFDEAALVFSQNLTEMEHRLVSVGQGALLENTVDRHLNELVELKQCQFSELKAKLDSAEAARMAVDGLLNIDSPGRTALASKMTLLCQRYDALVENVAIRMKTILKIKAILASGRLLYDDIMHSLQRLQVPMQHWTTLAKSTSEAQRCMYELKEVAELLKNQGDRIEEYEEHCKGILEEKSNLYDCQNLKNRILDLSSQFHNATRAVDNWLELMNNVLDFYRSSDALEDWLNAKQGQLQLLVQVATDSAGIESQAVFLADLRQEFGSQASTLSSLREVRQKVALLSEAILSKPYPPVEEKLNFLNQLWEQLLTVITERCALVEKSKKAGRQFSACFRSVQGSLNSLMSAVDLALASSGVVNVNETLNQVEKLSEEQKKHNADLISLEKEAKELVNVCDCPSTIVDVQSKVSSSLQRYEEIGRKIEGLRTNAESAASERSEIEQQLVEQLRWTKEALQQLEEIGELSANPENLLNMSRRLEEIFEDAMSKEGKVSWVLSKSSGSPSASKESASELSSAWQELVGKIKQRKTQVKCVIELQKQLELTWDGLKAVQEDSLKQLGECESSAKTADLETAKKLKLKLDSISRKISNAMGDLRSSQAVAEQIRSMATCDFDNLDERMQSVADLNGLDEKCYALQHLLASRLVELQGQVEAISNGRSCLNRLSDSFARCTEVSDSRDRDRLHDLLGEVNQAVQKNAERIELICKAVHVPETTVDELKSIQSDLMDLQLRLKEKVADADDVHERREKSRRTADELMERVQSAETQLADIDPRLRDAENVDSTLSLAQELLEMLTHQDSILNSEMEEAERLSSSGYSTDAAQCRQQLLQCKNRLGSAIMMAKDKVSKLTAVKADLAELLSEIEQHFSGITEMLASDILQGSLKLDIADLNNDHAKTLLLMFQESVESQTESASRVLDRGYYFVRSAAPGVDVLLLQTKLKRLDDALEELTCKFSELLDAFDQNVDKVNACKLLCDELHSWLLSTEDLVANQRPPSFHFKVAKAQLGEQTLLRKLLDDKHVQLNRLKELVTELIPCLSNNSHDTICGIVADLCERFDRLNQDETARTKLLNIIADDSCIWHKKSLYLSNWMQEVQKRIRQLDYIVTNEEKLASQQAMTQALVQEVEEHRACLDELVEMGERLRELLHESEVQELDDQMNRIVNVFEQLSGSCVVLTESVDRMHDCLSTFATNSVEVQNWIAEMERRVRGIGPISAFADVLDQQTRIMMGLGEEISNYQAKISELVELGCILSQRTTGDEAVVLQSRLDMLRMRYSDLNKEADHILGILGEALPLAESFQKIHHTLSEWLLSSEGDLVHLGEVSVGEQLVLIKNIQEDIEDYRLCFDQMNSTATKLCQLAEDGGSAIESMTSRLNCRFDSVCEQIQRKSERLCRAQLEWTDLANMLDDLIDWFHQMDDKLTIDSSPISASPDVIRQQLQSHVVAHEDVMVQKAKARELCHGAKRVLKVLNGEERHSLEDRVEALNELVDNVCSVSSSFLARLEEACTYAVEFDDACKELDEWLTTMETELENSPPLVSVSQPDRLKLQLDFAMTLYKDLLDARLSVEKMNKNGISLRPFVSQDDDLRIADAMEQIDLRFHVIRETVQMRIEALEEALSQTSQYTDRLDGMLESLNVCQESVNASGMISANPDRLRQQISENLAIVAEVERKSGAYQNLVDGAAEMASSGDELAMEIDQKVELLKSVWKDLLQDAESRRRTLQDALNLAEAFWAEFGDCLGDMKQLHECVVGAEKPPCQLPLIGALVEELQQLEAGFSLLEPRVDQCREVGGQLMELVDPAEKLEMMEKMDQLTNFQQVVCEALAQRSELLTTAVDKASLFHEKREIVEKFIADTEAFLEHYSALSSDPVVLQQQMVEVAEFKEKLDRGAVDLKQLNQLCSDLCELSDPAQSNSIKTTMGSLNKQWDTLNSSVVGLHYKLENTLLQMGHFHQAVDQLIDWIEKTEAVVASINTSPGDLKRAEMELVKMKVIQNDLLVHQVSVDTLNSTLMKTIESQTPKTSKELQDKVDTLNLRWSGLHRTFEEKMQLLEKSRSESKVFYDGVDDYISWMSDVEAALSVDRAVGGLPDTARDQLNRFMLIYKDVQERKPKIEQLICEGEAYVHSTIEEGGQSPPPFAELLKSLRERHEVLLQKVDDRKGRLSAALQEAIEYDEMMSDFIKWLNQAESYLNSLLPISRIKEKLVAQMQSHQAFQEQMDLYRTKGIELDKRGVRMTFNCLRKDATAIKNLLNTTVSRWNKMRNRAADRTRALDSALCETQSFLDQWNDLNNWCSQSVTMIESESDGVPRNSDRIKEALNQIAEFRQLLAARQSDFDAVCRLGKQLKNHGPRDEEPIVDDMLNTLKQKWDGLSMMTLDRQRNLEEALLFSGHFSDAVETLMSYLSSTEAELASDAPVLGDLDTVTALLEKHKSTLKGLSSRRVNVDTIRQAANKMMNTDSEYDANIANELRNLEARWELVNELAEKRQLALEDARKMAEQFHKDLKDLQDALADLEGRTKAIGISADHEEELQSRIDSVEELLANLAIHEPDLSSVIGLGGEIQAHCHPDAEAPVNRALMDLQNRWDQVKLLMTERCERLKNQLKTMQEMEILLDDLMQWMSEQQRTLTAAQEQSLPHDLEAIEKLLEEHEVFENQLQSRQPDVDAVTKGHRKAETEQRKESSSSKSSRRGHYVPSVKGKVHRKVGGNAKVKFVTDKWRDLWLRSMDYKKRLNETLEYEREVKRLKNFSFDEWRIRYLKWINHKKSRVMDFFRRLDKDCDGKVIRDDFIDGFLASKFPTSRVEMSFVADLFDRNQEGYIDYMEFIDALRPDREPVTEAEKIKDEVQRQAKLCTCDNKYIIKQIGDGQYKFGEQKRLVRILRSTVMVRVGGGWVSLTEYLMKYDPCRAKGKTNLELREKFILPDGASQSMWCFRSKGSKGQQSGSRDSSDCNTPGPIIKIREKTERSLPMYSRSHSRQKGDDSQEGSTLSYGSSRSIGERDQTDSPDSLSGSQTTPSGNNLKVPSAQVECRADCESVSMSRPPSRASTEVSEYSTPSRDSLSSPYPSRIPSMRRKKKQDGK